MSDLILHHYPRSPFAEKIRLALGIKRLAYASVIIPPMMPKPELMPLTGGYRRTPVLQVGADIYCDTLLILRELERRHPSPPLYPAGSAAIATALTWWAEKFTFVPTIEFVVGQGSTQYPPAFVADRKPFGFDLDPPAMRARMPLIRQRLHAHFAWLAAMLADGRAFLLGDAPSAADLAAYHEVWFLRRNGGAAVADLLPLAPLLPWADRLAGFGHGSPQDMTASEALAMATATTPPDMAGESSADLPGCTLGETVSATPDDTGRDPVVGLLLAISADAIVLRCIDPQVGAINVHFPRAGFDVLPA